MFKQKKKKKERYVPNFVYIGMVKKERRIVRRGKGFHGTSNEIVYLFCFVVKKRNTLSRQL